MLRVAVVEYDPVSADKLSEFIRQYARSNAMEISFQLFERGERFLGNYENNYDLIFLSMDLPGLDGMETAKRLRKRDSDVVLIFVTELARQAIRGYEVDALDFLMKPLNYYAFSLKMDKGIRRLHQRSTDVILLKTTTGIHRQEVRQIYYLETSNRLLLYHTSTGIYSVRNTMQSAQQELEKYHFEKCNQCYLVNLQHVTDVQDDTVTVAGETLEMSRRSKKSFLSALVAYIGGI